MANKRFLPCNKKEVLSIGAENSISDCKEKLKTCFDCHNFIDCKASQSILKSIENQQNALLELRLQGFYLAKA
jgi:hypothetical protein